ncbi:MAG: glycosyltransferase family 1 protein, partial [Anaerolineae bacterium]|nr:glycosyltransferase family 1 protein [Anaerolineae bacterium]
MRNQAAHIGLNAHLLSLSQSYRGAGISWYIFNLLTRLKQVSPDNFKYSAFLGDRAFQAQASGLALNFSRLPTRRPAARILWEQFVQPLALRRAKVDLLHALAFVAPLAAPCPFV